MEAKKKAKKKVVKKKAPIKKKTAKKRVAKKKDICPNCGCENPIRLDSCEACCKLICCACPISSYSVDGDSIYLCGEHMEKRLRQEKAKDDLCEHCGKVRGGSHGHCTECGIKFCTHCPSDSYEVGDNSGIMLCRNHMPQQKSNEIMVIHKTFIKQTIIEPETMFQNCVFVECKIYQPMALTCCTLVDSPVMDAKSIHGVKRGVIIKNCHIVTTNASHKAQIVDTLTKLLRMTGWADARALLGLPAALADAAKPEEYQKSSLRVVQLDMFEDILTLTDDAVFSHNHIEANGK